MNSTMMFMFLVPVAIMLVPFLPVCKKMLSKLSPKASVLGNIAAFTVATMILTVFVFSGNVSAADAAQTAAASGNAMANGLGYLAAALSTGMSTIGAGIAVASGASAAIGATSENPKMLSKGLIFVALGEGIVLYGLLMSFMILNKLG